MRASAKSVCRPTFVILMSIASLDRLPDGEEVSLKYAHRMQERRQETWIGCQRSVASKEGK
jgi:hypothetical protein